MSSILESIDEQLFMRRDADVSKGVDPMAVLHDRRLVMQAGNGLFVLRGPLVKLMRALDRELMKLADRLDAEEFAVPTILSPQNTEATQYPKSFPEHATLIRSTTPTDPESTLGMACPSVCFHVFAIFDQLPEKGDLMVTVRSPCVRQESGRLNDLSRLQNFVMREIVGLGSAAWCAEKVELLETETIRMIADRFDLAFDLTSASDPFFGRGAELKKKAQLLQGAKKEIRARLPHCDGSLALLSFNRHGNTFFKRFNIAAGLDQESFCVGFGYERFIYALLSQKGADFESPYYRDLLEA